MAPWAQRIQQLLIEGKSRGLTQTGLAKACGRSQPSVSQWFNDNDTKQSTQMILGDNLLAAAKYLGTTPEWIINGVNPSCNSQKVRLDANTIAETAKILRVVLGRRGIEFNLEIDSELFTEVYGLLESMPRNRSQEQTMVVTDMVIDLVAKRLERENGRTTSKPDRRSSRSSLGSEGRAA
ncbi:helix-turn-helix domain-containing protein [Xanthomonas sontii]|uniref:helix-turn-helix domain-containing protein n=1 Tax=Xanthomonas sontii TaxID=2650745 RepID=UPI003F826674